MPLIRKRFHFRSVRDTGREVRRGESTPCRAVSARKLRRAAVLGAAAAAFEDELSFASLRLVELRGWAVRLYVYTVANMPVAALLATKFSATEPPTRTIRIHGK